MVIRKILYKYIECWCIWRKWNNFEWPEIWHLTFWWVTTTFCACSSSAPSRKLNSVERCVCAAGLDALAHIRNSYWDLWINSTHVRNQFYFSTTIQLIFLSYVYVKWSVQTHIWCMQGTKCDSWKYGLSIPFILFGFQAMI